MKNKNEMFYNLNLAKFFWHFFMFYIFSIFMILLLFVANPLFTAGFLIIILCFKKKEVETNFDF